VSGADQSITILENGETVIRGKATIKNPDQPLGSHSESVLISVADHSRCFHI
jgi:hypothetical protein